MLDANLSSSYSITTLQKDLCLPGSFSAVEGVVVKQGQDAAVIGQQTSCYVDHPLTLLVGLCEDMETRC